MSVPVSSTFAQLAHALTGLEDQLRKHHLAAYAKLIAAKVVPAIHNRIEKSYFGDSVQPSGPSAASNAAYTLEGDTDKGGLREDETNGEEDGLRYGVHHDHLDNFGKSITGRGEKPLVESGAYLAAFRSHMVNGGNVYRIYVENSVGMKEPTDTDGLRLWEAMEFGTGGGEKGVPPRPHIGPGMRDAARQASRDTSLMQAIQHDIVEIIKRSVKP